MKILVAREKGHGPLDHLPQVVQRVRLQLENGCARHEGRGEDVIGIAGCGSNQVEGSRLGEIQEIILLCTAEAMDLVDEHEDVLRLSLLSHSLDVGNVAAGRVQRAELLLHLLANCPGNCRFTHPWWAKEDDCAKTARSHAPPQRPVRPQDVLLPNEVVESLRADLGGERLGTLLLSL